MTYYDDIALGYDELHKEEQLAKLVLIKEKGIVDSADLMLDVGCGTGFSLDYFTVKKAVGVEPSSGLIAQYTGDCEIIQGRGEELRFENDTFDVVISVTAIQNFSDVRKGLLEILRVGKNKFALTVLKKSPKIQEIEEILREVFADFSIELVEEEKDYIFFITK